MKMVQRVAVLLVASIALYGCVEEMSPDEFEVAEQAHVNHWGFSPFNNVMPIGVQANTEARWNGWSQTETNGCRNFLVRDHESSRPGLPSAGTVTFGTRDADVLSADYGYYDGYGGDVLDRILQTYHPSYTSNPARSYWANSSNYHRLIYEGAGRTYVNGSYVFRNTAVTDHPYDYCNHAFITTFWGDWDYYPTHSTDWMGAYRITVDLEIDITDQTACTTTHGDVVPWAGFDLYVYECPVSGTGSCQTVRPYASSSRPYSQSYFPVDGSVLRQGGTWSSGSCDTSVSSYYIPRVGYYPMVMNIVSSAGIGHVPAAAETKVWRLYNN